MKNLFCISEVATSGGKSLIISIVYFYTIKNIEPNAKLLIVVPSISLVTQMYDSIIDANIGENKEFDGGNLNPLDLRIEEVMSDKPRRHLVSNNPNIYIGTYQSLVTYDKKFFQQFHTVVTDEAHLSKSKSLISILEKTFGHAYSRFGVSGTFPEDDTCEILTIQSVLGPKITEVSATELKEKGIITPMEIKVVIMNHNDLEFDDRMKLVRKSGNGKDAFDLEKRYIHLSEKRLNLIKKIVDKCDSNTLLLFHTIEYGQKILECLSKDDSKEYFYIDGSISGKKREEIKLKMEEIDGKVKVLIASYGCLSTGVSIRNLHYLIMVDSFKSEQIVIQSVGRLLRILEGKEKAIIFDLVDVFKSDKYYNILYKHYTERQKFYIKREYPFKEIKINL